MDALLERLEERIGLTRADLLGVAIALAGCVVATLVAVRVPLVATADPLPAPSPSDEAAVPSGAPLVVHVTGAVHTPGVVELTAGDRVADAIAAAGGVRSDASVVALNLARPVLDGEQVVVPTVGEEVADGPVPAVDDPFLPDGRLDLNRATAAELEELPGVGPVLAERILAHREEHGPFTEPVELRGVRGIGEATWASLRDLVGVR